MKRFLTRAALALLCGLMGLTAAVSVAGLLYTPDITIPSGYPGKHIDVEGVPLRVLQEGTGRDILMIHGSPGVLEDFEPQARALAKSFRVTRYDRPGHGFSGDTGSYSFEHNARMARALIEKLGLERTIVVGHSYGGTTALVLARMKSPRVAGVIVLDSAVYKNIRPVNPAFRYIRLPAFGLGLARVVPRATTESRVTEAIVAEFKAGPPPQGLRERASRVFAEPKMMHAVANEHWYSNLNLARHSPSYGKIDVPVYIVAQRNDRARRETAERLHSEIAGSELLLVSPSGHFVQLEQADAVTDLIRRAAQK